MPWETEASWPLSAFLSPWDVCCAPGESPWHSSPQTRPRPAHPKADRPAGRSRPIRHAQRRTSGTDAAREAAIREAKAEKPSLSSQAPANAPEAGAPEATDQPAGHGQSGTPKAEPPAQTQPEKPPSQSPSGRNPSSRSRCVGIRRIRVPGRFRTTSDPHTSGQSATAQRTHRTRITGRPLPGRNRRGRRPGSRWTGDLRLSLPTSGPASRMLRTREGPPNRRVGRHPSSTGPRTSRRCRRSKAGGSARISQSDRMPSVPIRSRSTGVPYRIRNHSVQRRSRNHPGPREARTPAGRKARDPRASTASRRALREGGSKTRVTREETVR